MRKRIPVVSATGVAFGLFVLLLLALLSNSSSGGPAAQSTSPTAPDGLNPGPDAILGNVSSLQQFGISGTQVGLAMGTDICNSGNVEVDYFAMPNTDHPVLAQNLYRMSGSADRFEQIGQSWGAHGFFALQANSCGFGCIPASSGTHLGVGCSSADNASINSGPINLGSRAWVNPFTGLFPSGASNHTGHAHTDTSHRILVEGNDLDPAMNSGATYYAEGQFVSPHEYSWCQAHAGECNMFNNVSYRQFNVAGTTNFVFSAVGATVRTAAALTAWPGATIRTIEPEPGVDGRAFLAFKVTGPVGGLYHYEYAIYNENLDRGIQSLSVPLPTPLPFDQGIQPMAFSSGFHAPPQHPGFANDGTQGDAGFSNAPWTITNINGVLKWSSEAFAQNPNANAIRWGTLYNFRYDAPNPPQNGIGTVGFFKTGTPVTVVIPVPAPSGGMPTPTPTPPPGPATHFEVIGPAQVPQMKPFPFSVRALDQFNNTATGYTGTVHFTSTAGNALFSPPNGTLTNGFGTFGCQLGTLGNQTITATDTVNSSITGTSNNILVVPFQPPCPSGIPFSQNFDAQPTATPPFPPGWRVSNDNSDSAPNAMFCPEPPGVPGPAFAISSLFVNSSSAQISFRNNFNTVFRVDGGVLEIASPNISGGAFLDITNPALGSSFISGGYNTTMAFVGSPLDGRTAWSGDSGGYITTTIALGPNLVGQTISLRWRFGTAVGGSGAGWHIDTINSFGVCRPQQTPTPAPATHFEVIAPSSVGYLTPFFFTVRALDQSNNTATNYTGTVHFTTTASSAGLPPDSTLTEGFRTFSADLSTVGLQTITATDTANPSITGTSNQILVIDDQFPTPTPTATPTPTPACTPPPPSTFGFEDISILVSNGWFMQNNSQPGPGSTGWFQGNTAVFPAQSGPANSYIGANFTNGTGTSTISNWLLTPTIGLRNGMVLTFWTRTVSNPTFPDRLQVRMSTSGSSTNVGSNATDVGDFTTLLLDINPIYQIPGYPTAWAQSEVTISGVAANATGRFAFRYFVEDGGPGGPRSDYIGIDNVQVYPGCNSIFIPPPTPGPSVTVSPPPTPRALPTTPTPTPVCTPFLQPFDDVASLVPHGWFMQNNSQPGPGTTGWFQGNSQVFQAQSGAATSYIGTNFNNGTGTSSLSNWLLTPPVMLQNGEVLTFWTRTVDTPSFPDRLQVRMSTNGASVDVGTTATDVGDFTTLLLDINPTYTTTGYPNTWTQFTVTLSGIASPTQGRLALRYFVENGGPSGTNSDYIGIDTLEVSGKCGDQLPTPTPTPTPTATASATPGPVTRFVLTAPVQWVFDDPLDFGVQAEDDNGNINPSYSGTLHFTSSDPNAALPADSALTNGTGMFSATFHSLGNQTITATDTINPTITGTTLPILITGEGTPTPSPSPSPPTHAVNVSTRLFVQPGDRAGIGGFIVTGTAPKRLLFRGIGPSLTGVGVPDALADPTLDLRDLKGVSILTNNNWRDTQEAEITKTGIAPTNDLEAAMVATLEPGFYTIILRGMGSTSGVALVEIYDLDQSSNSKLGNLSTRAFVQTGNNVVIAGFILNGDGDDTIVARGIGPSLTPLGVPDALADPNLELRDVNGLVVANNDWQDDPTQAAQLMDAGLAPTNDLESGIVATLPPGLYTAVLSGRNNGTGVGLVEIYDLGQAGP